MSKRIVWQCDICYQETYDPLPYRLWRFVMPAHIRGVMCVECRSSFDRWCWARRHPNAPGTKGDAP